MNKKIFSKLLLCAVVLNTATPLLNAAEVASDKNYQLVVPQIEQVEDDEHLEIVDETASEMSEEVASEMSEEVASETSEEVESEMSEEVASETSEEVASETSEEVASEMSEEVASETSEEVASETSEDASTKQDIYMLNNRYIGNKNTQINEVIHDVFEINVSSDTYLEEGSIIKFDTPVGVEISNIVITNSNTGDILVEGSDYTLENNTITMSHDLALGTDLVVEYDAKLLNATTDILGATTSIFEDYNKNGIMDGKEYFKQVPGFNIEVINGETVLKEDIRFKSELVGGDVSIENNKSVVSYQSPNILTSNEYTITNTGDYAIEIFSIKTLFDLVGSSDMYYVFGVYVGSDDMEYSIDGSEYMSKEEMLGTFSRTSDEYLDPNEQFKIRINYEITEEMSKANFDEYNFGSWTNFVNNTEAELMVFLSHASNIFEQKLTDPRDVTIKTRVTAGEVSGDFGDTSEDVSTSEDGYVDMEVDDNSNTISNQQIANTGNKSAMAILMLLSTLVVMTVAKFSFLRK